MKLRLVLSGGQTGADKTGLICAKELGIATGGTAPKGYRTEAGPDLSLRDVYGLVESEDWTYQPRTRANVRDAEATLWFGNIGSPGYKCTMKAAKKFTKDTFENPDADLMKALVFVYEVVNVAGNRLSTNPKVVDLVRDAFKGISFLYVNA